MYINQHLNTEFYKNNLYIIAGKSEEANSVLGQLESTFQHLRSSYTRQGLLQKFYNLTATWQQKSLNKSNIDEICMSSEYQEIIGMGKIIIPLILMELKNKPDHWFWALKAISGENPVKPENRGNINEMITDWITWGKENGFI